MFQYSALVCLHIYFTSSGNLTCAWIFILTQLPLLRIYGLGGFKRANMAKSNGCEMYRVCVSCTLSCFMHCILYILLDGCEGQQCHNLFLSLLLVLGLLFICSAIVLIAYLSVINHV